MTPLVLIQHGIDDDEWSGALVAGIAALSCVGAWGLWRARRTIHITIRSTSFAAVLLICVGAATALGTFVPQNATDELIEQRYGVFLADWIGRLFLADAFHAYWFLGLMSLLLACLLFLVFGRPFWRRRYWGFALGHAGMAVVIIGASMGGVWGQHGMVLLRKGHLQNAVVADTGGHADGTPSRLGFAIRLDAFEVEKYPSQLRFVLLRKNAHASPDVLQMIALDKARDWTALRGTDVSFRVRESKPAGGDPTPARHLIEMHDRDAPLDVQIGQTYTLPGTQGYFLVSQFLPDFVYDIQQKHPVSASDGPRNPALLVEAAGDGQDRESHKQWLFANMPGHGQKNGDLPLQYTYVAPSRCATAVVETRKEGETAGSGEVLLAASGGKDSLCQIAGSLALVFENWEGEPKAYRSTVSVVEGGTVAKQATIAVNAPLEYGGYTFYQSDWRKEDPNYSGLKVVRDPGLVVVYSGMVMVALGVLFAFYVEPRFSPLQVVRPEAESRGS